MTTRDTLADPHPGLSPRLNAQVAQSLIDGGAKLSKLPVGGALRLVALALEQVRDANTRRKTGSATCACSSLASRPLPVSPAPGAALRCLPSRARRVGVGRRFLAKWEEANRKHAVAVVVAAEKDEAIPRGTQKRIPRPERLYRSRKAEERRGRHRVRIDEGVTRRGKQELYVPGVGELRTKEPIPDGLDVRSCVLLERTPQARLQRKPDDGERTFRIHIGGRVLRPELKTPDGPGACVGIDHGIVQQ